MYGALECDLSEDALPRNMTKFDEDHSNIEINCTDRNAIEFDIETVKSESKFEGTEDMTSNKNEYNVHPEEKPKMLLLSSMIKEKNAHESQLRLKSDMEFYINSEGIEAESKNADVSNTKDDISQDNNLLIIKPYKKKHNEDKQRRNRMFFCKICSTSYCNKFILNCHKLSAHGEGSQTSLYKCDQCCYRTGYKNSFNRHGVVHKNSSEAEVYKCKLCPFKTKYKHNLKGHSLAHIKSSCNDEVVVLNKNMPIHDDDSKDQLYTCRLCPYITKWRHALKRHDRTHKRISELTCLQCPYKAKSVQYFNKHMKTHETLHEPKSYNCNTCDFISKSKDSLTEHLLVHDDISEIQLYSCDKCPFKTKRKSKLKLHEMTHKDLPECYQSSFIKFFSSR